MLQTLVADALTIAEIDLDESVMVVRVDLEALEDSVGYEGLRQIYLL